MELFVDILLIFIVIMIVIIVLINNLRNKEKTKDTFTLNFLTIMALILIVYKILITTFNLTIK